MNRTHDVMCECGFPASKHGVRKNKIVPSVFRFRCKYCGTSFAMLDGKRVSFFGEKRGEYVESRWTNRDEKRALDSR